MSSLKTEYTPLMRDMGVIKTLDWLDAVQEEIGKEIKDMTAEEEMAYFAQAGKRLKDKKQKQSI